MKKSKKPHEKPLDNLKSTAIGLGALIIVVILLFVLRGWFRVTVIPKTLFPIYSNGVQTTFNKQMAAIQTALTPLGVARYNNVSNTCTLQQAQSFHTEIDCITSQLINIKLPLTTIGIANTKIQADNIQTLLATKGWQGGSNGVTFKSLLDGTTHGIDYSPDAFYEKVFSNNDCVFDTMIGYSNPQPPAVRVTLNCDRTINFLGAPKHETYNSAKGFQ